MPLSPLPNLLNFTPANPQRCYSTHDTQKHVDPNTDPHGRCVVTLALIVIPSANGSGDVMEHGRPDQSPCVGFTDALFRVGATEGYEGEA